MKSESLRRLFIVLGILSLVSWILFSAYLICIENIPLPKKLYPPYSIEEYVMPEPPSFEVRLITPPPDFKVKLVNVEKSKTENSFNKIDFDAIDKEFGINNNKESANQGTYIPHDTASSESEKETLEKENENNWQTAIKSFSKHLNTRISTRRESAKLGNYIPHNTAYLENDKATLEKENKDNWLIAQQHLKDNWLTTQSHNKETEQKTAWLITSMLFAGLFISYFIPIIIFYIFKILLFPFIWINKKFLKYTPKTTLIICWLISGYILLLLGLYCFYPEFDEYIQDKNISLLSNLCITILGWLISLTIGWYLFRSTQKYNLDNMIIALMTESSTNRKTIENISKSFKDNQISFGYPDSKISSNLLSNPIFYDYDIGLTFNKHLIGYDHNIRALNLFIKQAIDFYNKNNSLSDAYLKHLNSFCQQTLISIQVLDTHIDSYMIKYNLDRPI